MSTDEDNVVEFTGEWHGDPDKENEMTPEEYDSAMRELLSAVDEEQLGRTIAGVLEFLTMRAVHDGAYYIMTDDEQAITVFAANEDAKTLRKALPEHFKSWDDPLDEPDTPPFDTNSDPGDEQDEPASESE